MSAISGAVLALILTACGGSGSKVGSGPSSGTRASASPAATMTTSPPPPLTPLVDVTTPPPLEPVTVHGTVVVDVVILKGASEFKGPFVATAYLRPSDGGPEIPVDIELPSGNFEVALSPGTYSLSAIDIGPPTFGHTAVTVETMDGKSRFAQFTVPESGCLYVGRIELMYFRIPPGSLEEQTGYLNTILPGAPALLSFRKDGSLVFFMADAGSHVITLPAEGKRPKDARPCYVDELAYHRA